MLLDSFGLDFADVTVEYDYYVFRAARVGKFSQLLMLLYQG